MAERGAMKRFDAAAVGRIVAAAAGRGRDALDEHEIYDILRLAGFDPPRARFVADAGEIDGLDVPFDRAVCKLISPGMPHRFEHGGIRFTEDTAPGTLRGVFAGFESIAGRLGIPLRGMLVAERIDVDDAVPRQLLLSFRQDPTFGPVVFCGLGGVGTEVWKAALRPEKALFVQAAGLVDDEDSTARLLERTLFWPVVTGKTRVFAEPLVEPARLLDAIRRFAALALAFSPLDGGDKPVIAELEVNPVQIAGGRLVPLDGLCRLAPPGKPRREPPREGIARLLRPESVLIVGASARKTNMGRVILRNVLAEGVIPRDRVFLLHPHAEEIEGCRAWKTVEDLPAPADMVVFAIPADDEAVALLERIVDAGMGRSIVLISGGFGETEGGRDRDRALRASLAASHARPGGGVVLNGPNCMGIVSRPGGYNTFFLPEYKLSFSGPFGGRSAVISQSGAWLVTMLSSMAGVYDPRYMITVGNQMDLTVTDYFVTLADDPALDLYVLYVEGFERLEGERFLRAARGCMAAGKRIVLYKTGRTAAGAAAVASHTAAMAGDYEILSRLLEQAGVVVADTLSEMEDCVRLFTMLGKRPAAGPRVGILSEAGFECSIAADRLGGLELAAFAPATVERLADALPTGFIDVHNPVDATPAISTADYGRAVAAVIDDPGVDCVLVSSVAATPSLNNLAASPDHGEDIEREDSYPRIMIRLFATTGKPVVFSINEGRIYDPAAKMMEEAGLPVFRKIDRATRALGRFVRHVR